MLDALVFALHNASWLQGPFVPQNTLACFKTKAFAKEVASFSSCFWLIALYRGYAIFAVQKLL